MVDQLQVSVATAKLFLSSDISEACNATFWNMGFSQKLGYLFGVPIKRKDYSILGSILGSPLWKLPYLKGSQKGP